MLVPRRPDNGMVIVDPLPPCPFFSADIVPLRTCCCCVEPRRVANSFWKSIRVRGRSSSSYVSSIRGGRTCSGSGDIGAVGPSPRRYVWLDDGDREGPCSCGNDDDSPSAAGAGILAYLLDISQPIVRYLRSTSFTLPSIAPRQSSILASVMPSSLAISS